MLSKMASWLVRQGVTVTHGQDHVTVLLVGVCDTCQAMQREALLVEHTQTRYTFGGESLRTVICITNNLLSTL